MKLGATSRSSAIKRAAILHILWPASCGGPQSAPQPDLRWLDWDFPAR